MMVVDIQGMKTSDGFLLTDTGIHCLDLRKFGEGNWGEKGYEEFFKTHRCNQICKLLGLPRNRLQKEDDIVTDSVIRPAFMT